MHVCISLVVSVPSLTVMSTFTPSASSPTPQFDSLCLSQSYPALLRTHNTNMASHGHEVPLKDLSPGLLRLYIRHALSAEEQPGPDTLVEVRGGDLVRHRQLHRAQARQDLHGDVLRASHEKERCLRWMMQQDGFSDSSKAVIQDEILVCMDNDRSLYQEELRVMQERFAEAEHARLCLHADHRDLEAKFNHMQTRTQLQRTARAEQRSVDDINRINALEEQLRLERRKNRRLAEAEEQLELEVIRHRSETKTANQKFEQEHRLADLAFKQAEHAEKQLEHLREELTATKKDLAETKSSLRIRVINNQALNRTLESHQTQIQEFRVQLQSARSDSRRYLDVINRNESHVLPQLRTIITQRDNQIIVLRREIGDMVAHRFDSHHWEAAPGTVPEFDEGEDAQYCSICLTPYESTTGHPERQPRGRAILPCGHHFHVSCVREWHGISLSCPMCRAKLRWVLAAVNDNDEATAELIIRPPPQQLPVIIQEAPLPVIPQEAAIFDEFDELQRVHRRILTDVAREVFNRSLPALPRLPSDRSGLDAEADNPLNEPQDEAAQLPSTFLTPPRPRRNIFDVSPISNPDTTFAASFLSQIPEHVGLGFPNHSEPPNHVHQSVSPVSSTPTEQGNSSRILTEDEHHPPQEQTRRRRFSRIVRTDSRLGDIVGGLFRRLGRRRDSVR
jgi:hypothetical protein